MITSPVIVAVELNVASVPTVSFALAMSTPSNVAFCLNHASPVMSAVDAKEAVSSTVNPPSMSTVEPNVAFPEASKSPWTSTGCSNSASFNIDSELHLTFSWNKNAFPKFIVIFPA